VITVEKVRTWEAYRNVSTHGQRDPQAVLPADEWSQISGLVEDLRLVDAGLASASFAASVERRLHEWTADDETRELLRQLSAEHGRRLGRGRLTRLLHAFHRP
jgi:hypothetical protein